MMTGWVRSAKGDWYYCREINDSDAGRMETGWHIDMHDGRTYYLDPLTEGCRCLIGRVHEVLDHVHRWRVPDGFFARG